MSQPITAQIPDTIDEFCRLVEESGLLESAAVVQFRQQWADSDNPSGALVDFAQAMRNGGLLTTFQMENLLRGKFRGFFIRGKYKLLHRIGSGGMGSVYLCQHLIMKHRVALKILPIPDADDPDALRRFHQEAHAIASLNHPNIVKAHDVDNEGQLHFLVLEYVDGMNLYSLVKKHGPLSPLRAAHYIRQAATGLQHAHEAGIVHRDIKPGNLLLDRSGVVKILDLGLVRFFQTGREAVYGDFETGQALGTPDYLAPEQTFDSRVDIRADIYSLGVTFYYLVSGRNLFPDGTSAQKLIWHQVRIPKPVREWQPDVPEEMAAVIHKMLAKNPDDRHQTPAEVADALEPFTQEEIPPPADEEMPQPLLAGQASTAPGTATPIARQTLSPVAKIRLKER